MKFIVQDYGDPDVGIWGFQYEVHFNDGQDESFWDEEQIKYTKDFLKEIYDAKNCFTEAEFDEMNAMMEESFEEYEDD